MNYRAILTLVIAGFFGLSFLYSQSNHSTSKRIGVVVPIEHQAMKDMTDGFVEVVKQRYGSDIEIDIQNAQGDGTLQKAIIENFKRKNYDLIVPIGTDVTLMTQFIVKKKPVLGLDVTHRVNQEQPNVTGVRESPIEPSYAFIKQLIPHLKKVTMVYSASDKNYSMVQLFKQAANTDGVALQPVMIQSLADLYVLSQTIDRDSNAIFIAKDHLVASGASSLAQNAAKLGIPLITSDEGSIIAGGAVALGNKELDIGRAGGEIAIQLFEGVSPKEIPIKPISTYTVFVNKEAAKKQGLTQKAIQDAAKSLGYPVEVVGEEKRS